jgi:hypothetical protein
LAPVLEFLDRNGRVGRFAMIGVRDVLEPERRDPVIEATACDFGRHGSSLTMKRQGVHRTVRLRGW